MPTAARPSVDKRRANSKFFLRVAVMEVESWVMADRRGFADFLSIPLNRIPEDTDVILQPKEFLVSLARLSRKTRLRQEIVPLPGATSKVGPGYNSRLGEFVHSRWSVNRAASVSVSLQRTLAQLRTSILYDCHVFINQPFTKSCCRPPTAYTPASLRCSGFTWEDIQRRVRSRYGR